MPATAIKPLKKAAPRVRQFDFSAEQQPVEIASAVIRYARRAGVLHFRYCCRPLAPKPDADERAALCRSLALSLRTATQSPACRHLAIQLLTDLVALSGSHSVQAALDELR